MILAKVLRNWRQGNDKNDTMIRMIFFKLAIHHLYHYIIYIAAFVAGSSML